MSDRKTSRISLKGLALVSLGLWAVSIALLWTFLAMGMVREAAVLMGAVCIALLLAVFILLVRTESLDRARHRQIRWRLDSIQKSIRRDGASPELGSAFEFSDLARKIDEIGRDIKQAGGADAAERRKATVDRLLNMEREREVLVSDLASVLGSKAVIRTDREDTQR